MAKSPNTSTFIVESDYLSSEESDASNNYLQTEQDGKYFKLRRKEKCTSRNAVLARQNRIRKKMYIQNLENKIAKLRSAKEKLNTIVENQSVVITELRTEVKYVRSILANSSDLSKLIRNISTSTGMSVTSSLDTSLTTLTNCVSHDNRPATFWDDTDIPSLALPDLDIPDFPLPEVCFEGIHEHSTSVLTQKEHNYTKTDFNQDPGVCLHVSKHKVSLEFCAQCNNNACQTWKELE